MQGGVHHDRSSFLRTRVFSGCPCICWWEVIFADVENLAMSADCGECFGLKGTTRPRGDSRKLFLWRQRVPESQCQRDILQAHRRGCFFFLLGRSRKEDPESGRQTEKRTKGVAGQASTVSNEQDMWEAVILLFRVLDTTSDTPRRLREAWWDRTETPTPFGQGGGSHHETPKSGAHSGRHFFDTFSRLRSLFWTLSSLFLTLWSVPV